MLKENSLTNGLLKQSGVTPSAVSCAREAPPDLFVLVCQSWGVLVLQTESLSQIMKRRSEELQDGPISKLTLLIRDKQQLRKTYAEHWNLLRQELNKVGKQ